MFTLLNWMSLSGLSCIIHAEPRNVLLRLELLGLFYLSDRSMALWVVVIPHGICATLLWNPAWLPLHSHSFLCILLRNSAGKPGRFLVRFLSFPLSVQWSSISRGEDGEREFRWNWDCSTEEMQAQPGENEINLGRAANNSTTHQKCLNGNQCHIWLWFLLS